jgi:hypothetical protein
VRPVKLFSVGLEAHGVIAIGQQATGVVALGQLATGVLAVGQIARGVIAIGQVAVGLVAIGQVGVGVLYGGGMLSVGGFAGGRVPGGILGRLRLGDLRRFRFASAERRIGVGPLSVVSLMAVTAIVSMASLIPLWDELFGIGGVLRGRS